MGFASHKKAYFKCEHGHSFQANIDTFGTRTYKCPICKKKSQSIANRPEVMKFWDYEKNTIDPATVSLFSDKVVWFKCPKCGSEWQARIDSRRKTNKCPACETDNKCRVYPGVTDFRTLRPELALDVIEELNPDIDLNTLGISSNQVINWKCHVCGYEWSSTIFSRVFTKKRTKDHPVASCPACCKKTRAISIGEEYPQLIPYYSPNNPIPINELYDPVRTTVKWICPEHGEYEQSIHLKIKALKRGNTGCPYCRGSKVRYKDSFGAHHPELVKEWDELNDKSPYEVTNGSDYEAIWHCEHGHKWKSIVRVRANGYGKCPVCNKIFTFGERHPELKKFCCEDNDIPFENLLVSDDTPRKWICEHGHSFEDPTTYIEDRGFRCPVCKNSQVLFGYNDLQTLYPEIAKNYDEAKNGNKACEMIANTNILVWWKCEHGHSYQRTIKREIDIDGRCPICNNTRVQQGVNDLATIYPEIVPLWDYEANDKKPSEVLATPDNYYSFVCEKGHHFKARVRELVENGFKCQICDNTKLDPEVNSLKALKPELAKEWSPKNQGSPERTRPDSTSTVLWVCPVCGSEYWTKICTREVGDDSCPVCNERRVESGVNDLATIYPELVDLYSEGNEKPANQILATYKTPILWKCPDCHGEYKATIEKVVSGKECPYCTGELPLKGLNTLEDKYPKLVGEWSPKNDKKPSEVLSTSVYRAEWICPDCGGTYIATVRDRINPNFICPICDNRIVYEGINSLQDEYPELVGEWSPKNDKKPSEVLSTSTYRAEWICPDCGGVYIAAVRDRINPNFICPICDNRKACVGINSLQDLYPELLEEWCNVENTLMEVYPDEVLPSSGLRVWWECKDCKRKYLLSIGMRIEKYIRGQCACTYCNGQRMRENHILI